MNYKDIYNLWLQSDLIDDVTKSELKSISGEKEIEDRFYRDLEFGTGGLRGVIGAGTNRMNIYTIRKATQGLANYILSQSTSVAERKVAIAYDSRHMSYEFATQAALVLNGNGISSYIYKELMPTPMLSFAVRNLGCISGIVVTASHNPAEYNGYKVYWSDGGQVPYPRDNEIITEVNKITDFSMVKFMDLDSAKSEGLFNIIGDETINEFVKNVKSQMVNPNLPKELGESLKIVYTPIHGTGNKPVRRVLDEVGFKHVAVVPEQENPNGDFPTVEYPNPEDPKAFTLARELADKISADIIVGTDPDCDRVGVVVKNSSGQYVVLTGNMTGALLTHYILSQKKENNSLPANGALVSTIVSSRMGKRIADSFKITYFDVLTGFKYIGEKIKQFETNKDHTFIFGYEESYGCLSGTYARDKDAVVATMLICEMAAYYKTRGMTLYDGLLEIYEEYGYFKEGIQSITMKGMDGIKKINELMDKFRSNAPAELSGKKVLKIHDYQLQKVTDLSKGSKTTLEGFPVSNVLHFELEDDTWFCIRPSGTEPKIKIYFGVKGTDVNDADAKLSKLTNEVMALTQI